MMSNLFNGPRGRLIVMIVLAVAAICLTYLMLQTASLPGASGGMAVALVGLFGVLVAAVGTVLGSGGRNARDEDAILRLLDEMSPIADGDLTAEATVTGDVTGAIADSVNATVESLRELVTTINGTAEAMADASDESLTTAKDLTRASQTQTRQILTATETIQKMVDSIQEVSRDAKRASEVTGRSVDTANRGSEAVLRTIEGMGSVRDQIQETSKRIKRLGESSQEIGDIVELINDIAEQTNTLALNASIQAATAGEAGRGFAVVADEVQRLAERSTNATRQIEALVRTIQADTHEAVISMEKSTSGVVNGARLAENAGTALEEIEQVSREMADLVQGISGQTDRQTQEAGSVSETMAAIQEITEQTASGTQDTGKSIAQLAELGAKLRASVSGFKLPERRG